MSGLERILWPKNIGAALFALPLVRSVIIEKQGEVLDSGSSFVDKLVSELVYL